jgi:hypothetical protein
MPWRPGSCGPPSNPTALARTLEALFHGSLMTWAFYQEGNAARWLRRDVESVLAPTAPGAGNVRSRGRARAVTPVPGGARARCVRFRRRSPRQRRQASGAAPRSGSYRPGDAGLDQCRWRRRQPSGVCRASPVM